MLVHAGENLQGPELLLLEELPVMDKITAHDLKTDEHTWICRRMEKDLFADQHLAITPLFNIDSFRNSTSKARKHYYLYGPNAPLKTKLARFIAATLNCEVMPHPSQGHVSGLAQFYILEWGGGAAMSIEDVLDFTCGNATFYSGQPCRADAQLIVIANQHPYREFGVHEADHSVQQDILDTILERFELKKVE